MWAKSNLYKAANIIIIFHRVYENWISIFPTASGELSSVVLVLPPPPPLPWHICWMQYVPTQFTGGCYLFICIVCVCVCARYARVTDTSTNRTRPILVWQPHQRRPQKKYCEVKNTQHKWECRAWNMSAQIHSTDALAAIFALHCREFYRVAKA